MHAIELGFSHPGRFHVKIIRELYPGQGANMSSFSRRELLKRAAAAAGGAVALPMLVPASVFGKNSPSNRLNLAVIGLGGQGGANLKGVKDQNLVALCDVDDKRAGKAYESFPKAQKFKDFRKMFDAVEKKIDGAVISTPDHAHFHPAWWAMQRGKHVYLEKPMAHNVWEVRELTKLAAEKKLATQLGVQRHVLEGLRRGVEIVKSGALGTITEVHSWLNSSRGMPAMPEGKEEVPATLDWDLWLGPAAERPYKPRPTCATTGRAYWWDFGTGDAGNWGCHILDIPYWSLGLKYPTKVEGSGPTPDKLHSQGTFRPLRVPRHGCPAGRGPALALSRGFRRPSRSWALTRVDSIISSSAARASCSAASTRAICSFRTTNSPTSNCPSARFPSRPASIRNGSKLAKAASRRPAISAIPVPWPGDGFACQCRLPRARRRLRMGLRDAYAQGQ